VHCYFITDIIYACRIVDKSITRNIIFLLNFIIVLVFGWVLDELGEVKSKVVNKIALHEHVNNSLTNLPYFLSNGLVHTDWFCAQIT
jgi:hypothetical protein